ncbi:hypothetical protein KFE96_04520 [Kordiimonas sp. SCSIO 12603]|uniref:hypothetical protein n=1 Tax=Kordiimonas sp. SCSIO 12603 TaxID=2829596 RepID=UPI002103FF77|nr:hypothetical protein [Kordiimonas sp. SCSIO 12603]UTW59577.1 hypothetical protein KFE96_04520 [Kordiimonas sp. SCSIO 12603]
MNIYLVAAAAASFLTFAIHTWVGGPVIAKPLVESDMHRVPKYTNYACWHIVTIMLFAMGGAFLWAAYFSDAIELAWFAFLLSSATLVWFAVLILWKRLSLVEFPQWALFVTIDILAFMGLV